MLNTRQLKTLVLVAAFVAGLLTIYLPAEAQGAPGEQVRITASDGLELAGEFFAPEDTSEPAHAVILMHHGGSRKEAWRATVPVFSDAGYAVLSIDLRGHGESPQDKDWDLAIDDTQRWLDWLSAREDVDAAHISVVGASIGGDHAVNVMVVDERIQTLVWISPLVEVDGVTTDDALAELNGSRPIFMVTAAGDAQSLEAARELFPLMGGDSQVRIYDTSGCCIFMYRLESSFAEATLDWLETYG